MKHTAIKLLFTGTAEYIERDVAVCGWVRTLRSSGKLGFIELNDGTCFKSLQIVFEDSLSNFEEVARFSVGAALCISGKLVATPDRPQPFELHASEIVLEGDCDNSYPLQKKRHTLEYLRTLQHLRPRTNTVGAALRVRSVAAYAIHTFFNERGFVYAHTPIITGSDCEGAGEMFRVTTLDPKNPPLNSDGSICYAEDFFGNQTSLTVSGQLEAECMAMAYSKVYTFGPTFRAENSNTTRHAAEFWMVEQTSLTVSGQLEAECMAMAYSKVYTFGPTFRAENSNTTRHAAEFWMVEPELAFCGLDENMQLAEDMLKYVIDYVIRECPDELEFFQKFYDSELLERLKLVRDSDFARITYTEAVEILQKQPSADFKYPPVWGSDLQTEHERFLTEKVFKKPLFVTDYPKEIKSFYMRMNDDNRTVAAMDLLVPGIGEIVGGSQREERLEVLERRMSELGLPKDDYWWYLELRRYGGTRHAGFGLGFERFIMYLTAVANIRDVIPFPRVAGSAGF